MLGAVAAALVAGTVAWNANLVVFLKNLNVHSVFGNVVCYKRAAWPATDNYNIKYVFHKLHA